MTRLLWPLAPVQIGDALVFVDQTLPVGLWQENGLDTFIEWSHVDIPVLAFHATTYPGTSGVWIEYAPTPDVVDASDYGHTAAYVERDGAKLSLRLGDLRVLGSDSVGLWCAPSQPIVWSDDYLAGHFPATWSVDLVRHHTDGSQTRTKFDRPVQSVSGTDDGLRIHFHPDPPTSVDLGGRGTRYVYRIHSIDVPERALDGGISAADYEHSVVTEDQFEDGHNHSLFARFARQMLLGPHELPEGIRAEWPQVDRHVVDVEAVEARGLREFRAASSHLSDAEVSLEGTWPEVTLQVAFSHDLDPEHRVRYSRPLFEQGGRPALDRFASDDFVEDARAHPGSLPRWGWVA